MLFLYDLLSYLIQPILAIAGLFSKRLHFFLKARAVKNDILPKGESKRILMHCASLGEYEQGKTIIEKCHHLGYEILVSFFSPSGYEHQIKSPDSFVKQYLYLPIDTPRNQKAFLESVQPDLVIFVKNEFWFSLLEQLHKSQIPHIFISMFLTGKKRYFQWPYVQLFKGLKNARHLFVQDENTKKKLETLFKKDNISIAGDNRIESILNVVPIKPNELGLNLGSNKRIIYGSVYRDDVDAIKTSIESLPDYKHIVIPHHLDLSTLSHFKSLILTDMDRKNIIIVEKMGFLKHLYKGASIAYIGGGFQKGIHNTLEALVHYVPVVIGPNHKGFKEIEALSSSGFIIKIQSQTELAAKLKTTLDGQLDSTILKKYIESNAQNSARIVDYIQKIL